jgi:hypothetical protein
MTLQPDLPSAGPTEQRASMPPNIAANVADRPEDLRARVWRDLGREAGAGNDQVAVLEAILKAAFQLFPDASSGALFLYHSERLTPRLSRWADGRADGPAGSPWPRLPRLSRTTASPAL